MQRVKVLKERSDQILSTNFLAETENEDTVTAPEIAVIAIVAAEPQTSRAVCDAEQKAVAARVRNGFHGYAEPFAFRLVRIL